jgi:glycosyltransferase involved in cell wall biosynthesis
MVEPMKVAFHANHLDLRGTGVAVFDYANHCEKILGHESIIVCPALEAQPIGQSAKAAKRFESRFQVHRYGRFEEVEPLLEDLGADVFYTIKSGPRDYILSRGRKTVVHVVFQHYDPHGDVYAYVSRWLSEKMSQGRQPWVPHMVDLPDVSGDLRDSLEIPRDAIVFGRYGANDTFDMGFVHRAVVKVAKRRPDVYFVFMNTDRFCRPKRNILHLPATTDVTEKLRFINTCDAMLHARKRGESFGLAVAEFSARNRPVITFDGGTDRAHLEQLGDKGIYYRSKRDLMNVLDGFEPDSTRDWDAYSCDFGPKVVMERFSNVFLS